MKNSKTKKILSILLAVVMVVGVLPITAFAVAPSEPTNLRWDGTTAKWDSVAGAVRYAVVLYPVGGGSLFAHDGTTETQYTGFDEYMVPGMQYEFGVMAYNVDDEVSGNGNYTWSEAYTMPGETLEITNIKWDGYTLTWDDIPGASGYWVALDKMGETSVQVDTNYPSVNSCDLMYGLAKGGAGDYKVRISAYYKNLNNTMAYGTLGPVTFNDVPIFIDKIEITDVMAPQVGASSDMVPTGNIPSNANYSIKSTNWANMNGQDMAAGSVILGNEEYFAEFVVAPDEGCLFADYDTLDVKINGEEAWHVSAEDGTVLVRTAFASEGYYTVNASANIPEAGSVTGGGVYDPEEMVTLNAIANPGYAFKEWQENGVKVSENASYTIVMTENRNLVAIFEQVAISGFTVSVSASPEEGGTVTGNGIFDYDYASLTATANPGYEFYRWTENGAYVSNNNPYKPFITTDRTFVAEFNKLIVDCELTGFTAPTPGMHTSDCEPAITIETGKGFTLKNSGWSDSNGVQYSGYFEKGKTYYARFNLIADEGYVFDNAFSATIDNSAAYSVDVYNSYRENDAVNVLVEFVVEEKPVDPVANVADGTSFATDDMPVTITCEDTDAEIYVGLYGNDPRLEASSYRWKWTNGDTLYMGRNYETSLSSFDGYTSKGNDVSLKIASVKDGVWSDVVTYTYHKIGSGEMTAPTATPGSCTFAFGNSIKVSLKSDVKGAVIMYSRDGGETSYTYTSPLTVSKATELTVWTVSAFTTGKNYLSSKVTYNYTEKPGVGGRITTFLDNSDAVTTIELWNADNTQLMYSTTETGKNPTYSIPVTEYGTYNLVVTTVGHVPYYKTINLDADSTVQDVELQLYADTNFDGAVDVQDYQALINAVLSDDHEQIETEEYDDLIHYDLAMDGYLDVLDAAVMALVVNGHKTIDEVYDIQKGDYDYDGEAYTESDLIAMYHVLSDIDSSAPTLSTSQKFASDLNYNGEVDEGDLAILTGRYGTIESTTCEGNIMVYYRWGNSYTTCTATAICTICDKHVAKETVNSVKNADGSYTATFKNTLLGTKTYKKQ